jgi:hypothetical protein
MIYIYLYIISAVSTENPELGGTPGSPYGPLPSFDYFNSLPFCIKLFFNKKYMYFSWVPGG